MKRVTQRILCMFPLALLSVSIGCAKSANSSRIDLPIHRLRVEDSTPETKKKENSEAVSDRWYVQPKRRWRHIVLHHSATDFGNARVFDRHHRQRGWDELGYHFLITNGEGGRDGAVHIGSRWRKQKHGAHTGGTPNNEYNEHGIGICLIGSFSDELPTEAQLASLRRLLLFLLENYDISPNRIIGHRDAPNSHTACPGDAFERYLRRDLIPSIRKHP